MKITLSQKKVLAFYNNNSNWFDDGAEPFLNEAGDVVILCPDRIYKISRRGGLTDTLIETVIKNKNK